MTKGSPDYKKRLVSIKGARVAPSNIKGDLVTLGGKAKNSAGKDLATKAIWYRRRAGTKNDRVQME